MFQKYIKLLVITVLMLSACKSEVFNFSETPVLTFNTDPEQVKRNGLDSLVKISIKYTDGDGDIGLEPEDTLSPFNYGNKFFYNLFIYVYKIEDGVSKPILIPLSTDTVQYHDRITNLTPTGKNKSIYGEIALRIKALPYPGVKPDSMYYTIQIADRKLHLSNIIQTPVMKFEF